MNASKKHILLVDDPSNGFNGGAPPVRGSAQRRDGPTIYALRHPKGGKRRYILSGQHLLELHRLSPQIGQPCSWFVDQSVKSDGGVLVATPVDPLLLALPLLDKATAGAASTAAGYKFSPLHQYLRPEDGDGSVDMTLLLRVDGLKQGLSWICDTYDLDNGQDGQTAWSDSTLYRLNREKARAYLVAKVRRLAYTLQQQAEDALTKARAAAGSFNVGTTVAAAAEAGASSGGPAHDASGRVPAATIAAAHIQSAHIEAAVSLLAENLTDAWILEVADALRVPLDTLLPAVAKQRRLARMSAASSRPATVPMSSPVGSEGSAIPPLATPATVGQSSVGRASSAASSTVHMDETFVEPTADDEDALNCGAGDADGPDCPDDEDMQPSRPTSAAGASASVSKAAAWNAAGLADSTAARGASTGTDSAVRPPEAFLKRGPVDVGGSDVKKTLLKTPAQQPSSFAAKRLASTNTKGMKSMASWFGAKKE